MIQEFFTAQCENTVKGDWVLTVKQDLVDLDVNLTFEQIRTTSRKGFSNVLQ